MVSAIDNIFGVSAMTAITSFPPTDSPSLVSNVRHRTVIANAIAYIVVLYSCAKIWLADPTLLYIGRDADFSLWLASEYSEWAHPFSVTTMNPFQAMGSMLMPINPYFNPGAWVFWTSLGTETKFVTSMVVYFLEVTFSSFLLARVLGFSFVFSLAAALWLVVLFFPPFNFVFGLQGILATSPQWGNGLAICNLTLVSFFLIGEQAWRKRGWIYASAINAALAIAMVLLVLLCLLNAPFYNAAVLLGSAFLCAVILFSSSDVSQFLWRLGAGLFSLVIFEALGLPGFFVAAKSFTARFATASGSETSLPQFHWPVDLSASAWASAQDWFCSAAVGCGRITIFPGGLTGSYWLHAAIIGGGIVAWSRFPRPLSRIGGWFSLFWTGLLLFWLCCALGIVTNVVIAPIYIVIAIYPFWALFSLLSVWFVIKSLIVPAFAVLPRVVVARGTRGLPFVLPVVISLFAVTAVWTYGGYLQRTSPFISYFIERGVFDARRSGTIVDLLRREIALFPGDAFRGSVATILGSKGGSLRVATGIPTTVALPPSSSEKFMAKVRASTGNDHDLFDLWWFNIPTVSEYAQGISRQFMFYVTNFLQEPDDPDEVDVAFPRLANVDILRAMGVRFIIIDKPLSDERVALRLTERVEGGSLYLYEVSRPNLGNYSPVDIQAEPGLENLKASLTNDPAFLSTRAYVQSPIEGAFVAAVDGKMNFEKGGLHVAASSSGRSLLLLPLQFSHCLTVSDPNVKISRANVLFTLVQFEGRLDADLRWQFNFWRHGSCRMQDVADLRSIGLLR
jgi:hypothetical protein